MTEEIIKECKNCDALGIDSEIGVYYCCLSHRQDDLPKEFTCNDFTPNKQLKRLEQEKKEIKEKQRPLEVDKQLYDAYCETHCRANDIAIDLHREFDFMEQREIIPIIKEGIRILRFQRNQYRSALEEIKNDLKEVCKEECDYTKPKFCGDCDCRYGQILDKINEVLNDI